MLQADVRVVQTELGTVLEHIELDEMANELFLFHGLPTSTVPMVANSGFDERVAKTRGLYGAGIYLTDKWCKALQYCDQKYPKHILHCRAVIGEPYYVKDGDNFRDLCRPPCRTAAGQGAIFDNIIAQPGVSNCSGRRQLHREFVLFDRKSVYPEFVIELSC